MRQSRGRVDLLPIFRSQAQFRLLGELYTNPGREFTIGDLAQRAETSGPTASREVARLGEAGLVTTREEGRRRLVRAAQDTPVFTALRDLLAPVYGVPAVLAEEFAGLDATIEIFGSFAERWFGAPGPIARDIDVLVVGDVDVTAAWDAASRTSRRLGIEVNVVVRTAKDWEASDTGFADQVKAARRLPIAAPEPAP